MHFKVLEMHFKVLEMHFKVLKFEKWTFSILKKNWPPNDPPDPPGTPLAAPPACMSANLKDPPLSVWEKNSARTTHTRRGS